MHPKGFTLIELLVTIAIAAIVAMFAVPNFTTSIRNSRTTTYANEFLTALNLARSEAIKRGKRVYLERKSNTAKKWDDGWRVFIDSDDTDTDGDGLLFDDGTDTLLKDYQALQNNFTLRSGTNYSQWMAFLPSGLSKGNNGLANDTLTLCASSGNTKNYRKIKINVTGRTRVESPGGAITCP